MGNRPAAAGGVGKMTMTTRGDVPTVSGIQVDRVEDIEGPTFVPFYGVLLVLLEKKDPPFSVGHRGP